MRIKKQKNRKMLIIILIAAALVLIGGISYWQRDAIKSWFNTKDSSKETKPADNQTDNSGEPYSDSNPYSDPKSDAENPDANTNNTNSGSIASATLVINDAAQYGSDIEVRSYLEKIIETDGTCTFVFKKGSRTITKTTGSLPNPSYTTCEALIIPTSEFPEKGTWQLTVNYTSPHSQGSAARSVEVK